jgi:hypothetical protein
LFRAFFRITEQDGDEAAREKIAGRMLLLDEALRDGLPLVFDFLGVRDPDQAVPSIDPDARKAKLLASVRHLVQARSASEPLLIFVDDAHWIDSGSDEFLAQVVEAAGGARALVLVNFRPEYHAEWTAKSYYRQVSRSDPSAPTPAVSSSRIWSDGSPRSRLYRT